MARLLLLLIELEITVAFLCCFLETIFVSILFHSTLVFHLGGRRYSFSLSSKQYFSKWRATCLQCLNNCVFGCIGFGVPLWCTGFCFISWRCPVSFLGLSFYVSTACRLLYISVVCSSIFLIDCCAISSVCLLLSFIWFIFSWFF